MYEVKVSVPLPNSGEKVTIVYMKKNNVNFKPVSNANPGKG